jgi:branched-chain amino acid transport system permease protein
VALFVSALIIGITLGTVYGLMAFGMVASYRISRVVNLGQAGIAAFGASLYWWMATQWGAPLIVCLLGAVVVGGLFGAILGYLNLRMSGWPKGLVMIFTLTITLLLFAWVDLILPSYNASPPSVFGASGFNFALTYVSADQIGSFVTCILAVVLTTWVLRRTRFGMFVRAIYDDPDGASTVGIPLTTYVVGVWTIAGCMASLAGILVSTRTQLDSPLLLFVMVWGLAGAVLGGLESFALAFAGGLLLGIAEGLVGGVFAGSLGPGLENLTAIVIMAAGVVYAGKKRRHLAHLQT